MTNKLVHDAAVTITEQQVINNDAYPLVRELAYTYGTQVIHASDNQHPKAKLYLAREDGICVGYVKHDRDSGFGFRSVVATKERGGRTFDDKYTWWSSKLASLMRNIKKEKLLPSGSEKIIQDDSKIYNSAVNMIASFGDGRKQTSLPGDDAHEVLEIVFGNQNIHELSIESMAKYKEYLDKYRRIDTIREKRETGVREFFSQPLWAVCYDNAQSFLVGKLSYDVTLDSGHHSGVSTLKIDIAQPFKRVLMPDDIPELMPKLTMFKVMMQQKDWSQWHGEQQSMPASVTGWFSELDLISYSARSSWDEGILKGDWLIFKE